MSKFYVTCGSHTIIVTAANAEQAATRLIDEVLAAHIWIYDDAGLSDQDRRDHLVLEALLHLGTQVKVSQRGLDRDDAGTFDVPELLEQWHRLMSGVSRLFVAAGLVPRRVWPALTEAAYRPRQAR